MRRTNKKGVGERDGRKARQNGNEKNELKKETETGVHKGWIKEKKKNTHIKEEITHESSSQEIGRKKCNDSCLSPLLK